MEHPERASLVSSSGRENDQDKGIDGSKKASNSKEETEPSPEVHGACQTLVYMSKQPAPADAHFWKEFAKTKARMSAGEASDQVSSHNMSEKKAVIPELPKQPKDVMLKRSPIKVKGRTYYCKNCGKPCYSPQQLGGHTNACNRLYHTESKQPGTPSE